MSDARDGESEQPGEPPVVPARSEQEPAPEREARLSRPEPTVVSARMHAVLWLAVGCALVGAAQVPMALLAHRVPPPPARALASVTGAAPPSAPPPSASAIASAGEPPLLEPDAGPPPFRIAQLESDAIDVVGAKVGKRTCRQALAALGVDAGEIARLATAAAVVRKLEGCRPEDRLSVATYKADKKLAAFELETTPGEILRVMARALAPSSDAGVDAEGSELFAEQISLPVTHRRHAAAVVVGADLAASLAAAGLDPSLVEPLDEALSTRSDVPPPRAGSVLRVVADATYVAGRFDRYDELVAFEYRPRADAAPLRLYHLRDPKTEKTHGWFDGKGHAPIRVKWRMPLAFPRITSRFNPKRFHPVLHVVTPHNGCDFAAAPGTPVYAIGAGVVTFRGESGPSGNLVMIRHEGGIESGYAHLSRFVPGVVAGTHVEPRTLIGYSGSTGRSTGPHLHLSVKRNGVFIDPLSLKMDGFRVVPSSERNGFTTRKLSADQALDAIPLPKVDAPPPPPEPAEDTPGE